MSRLLLVSAVLLALLPCGRSAPERGTQEPLTAADAGARGVKAAVTPPPRPDTLPEILSMVTDTAEVPLRRHLGDGIETTPVAFTFRIGHGPEPGRLRFSTTLVDLGPPLEGQGPPHRQLILRSCPFALQVHRSADLQGKPAWDSWRWLIRFNDQRRSSPSGRRLVVGCPDANPVLRLPPGDSLPTGRLLGWDGHVMDILGDSLPQGRYYFRAKIRLPGDTLWLPAGSVDLRRVPLDQAYRAEDTLVTGMRYKGNILEFGARPRVSV